ncbi:hypothetical protein I3679_008760 [Proteus mirabilis]|uniref:Uncharacterized protein n=1 Tax=Proteus mirabilis TaxID=584 RepID=A0ABD5LS80_PROMI
MTYSDDNGEREDCPKNYKLHDNPSQRLADYLAVLDKLSLITPILYYLEEVKAQQWFI